MHAALCHYYLVSTARGSITLLPHYYCTPLGCTPHYVIFTSLVLHALEMLAHYAMVNLACTARSIMQLLSVLTACSIMQLLSVLPARSIMQLLSVLPARSIMQLLSVLTTCSYCQFWLHAVIVSSDCTLHHAVIVFSYFGPLFVWANSPPLTKIKFCMIFLIWLYFIIVYMYLKNKIDERT